MGHAELARAHVALGQSDQHGFQDKWGRDVRGVALSLSAGISRQLEDLRGHQAVMA
jgi:hypothetical protein